MRALSSAVVVLLAMLVCALPTHATGRSSHQLQLGARPLALGDAFVGLADDESAALCNPAGLAFTEGVSFASSSGIRSGLGGSADVLAVAGRVGLAVLYRGVSDIPQIDPSGSVVGSFSHEEAMLVGAIGVTGNGLRRVLRIALPEWLGVGLAVKLVRTNTLNPGDGMGLAVDVLILLRIERPAPGESPIARFSVVASFRDAVGIPMTFAGGYREPWSPTLAVRCSVLLESPLLITAEFTSARTGHLGLEWTPVRRLQLRSGLKYEGAWTVSTGFGLVTNILSIDVTTVWHPHLPQQIRVSLWTRL